MKESYKKVKVTKISFLKLKMKTKFLQQSLRYTFKVSNIIGFTAIRCIS